MPYQVLFFEGSAIVFTMLGTVVATVLWRWHLTPLTWLSEPVHSSRSHRLLPW
jgi:hypothetical protein